MLGIKEVLHPISSSLVEVLIRALQFSRESYTVFSGSTHICSNIGHSLRLLVPIDFTELDMFTESKFAQTEIAELPIDVTEFGMVIDVRLLQ